MVTGPLRSSEQLMQCSIELGDAESVSRSFPRAVGWMLGQKCI